MAPSASKWALGFGGLALVFVFGCGVFDTREPEDPGNLDTIDLSTPTDPDTVLTNVRRSLEALLATAYASQINEEFVFVPDPIDEAEFPVVWGKDQEEQAHISILTDVDSVTLTWGDAGEPNVDGDQQWYDNLPYSLAFSRGQDDAVFSGIVDLYLLELANSTFQIIRWEDLSDGTGAPTWGRLRIDRSAF